MKPVLLTALLLLSLVAAALLQPAAADYLDGEYRDLRDLNDTNVCFEGVFNHSLLETNTSGWSYNATRCSVAANSYVNVSGMMLPILFQGVPVIPVGFNFRSNAVGEGSALVIQAPPSNLARMVMPWFVEIVGNTFGRDAQLRVIGSLPINSTLAITQNTFDVTSFNPYLTDTLDRVMAISLAGNLTTEFEPMSLYHNSRLAITENVIAVDAIEADMIGIGISILADVYFTDNATLTINRNKVTATCGYTQECFGFETSSYLTLPEGYADSWATLDENEFTVRNGRGFVVPLVWSPNATFYVSASRNVIGITLEESAKLQMSEHAITFDDMSAGLETRVEVCQNVITAMGNTILFFAGALDFTGDAVLNCSWNDLFTTTGDATVYVIDQISLTERSSLTIDYNRFQRQDDVAVSRPYLSLTYDLAVLGYSLFSFSNNECYPKHIASGPRLAILTEGRVANVGPTAYFAICGNIYNGNPADLMTTQLLLPNLRNIINCNPRTSATSAEPTTEDLNATTAEPPTTTVTLARNEASATPAAVAVVSALVAALALLL